MLPETWNTVLAWLRPKAREIVFAISLSVLFIAWDYVARIPEWLGMNPYYRDDYGAAWAVLFFGSMLLVIAIAAIGWLLRLHFRSHEKWLFWSAVSGLVLAALGLVVVITLLLFAPLWPISTLYSFWVFSGIITGLILVSLVGLGFGELLGKLLLK